MSSLIIYIPTHIYLYMYNKYEIVSSSILLTSRYLLVESNSMVLILLNIAALLFIGQ